VPKGTDQNGASPQELLQQGILTKLDELGGQTVRPDDLTWRGDKFVLPEALAQDLGLAIETLQQRRADEEEETDFTRTYPYRPFDGAAAFHRAVVRIFGVSPAGKSYYDFFGRHRPTYISVHTGVRATIQVPWDRFELSLLRATFNIGAQKEKDGSFSFSLRITAPRGQMKRIDAFLTVVEDELIQRSIYRGKALSGDDGTALGFFSPKTLDAAKIIYNREVMEQLEANVWTPLAHADLIRELGFPLRRAVLLEGPNGTGKTSAGVLTAQKAVAAGWTFILVRKGEDPLLALTVARQYAPAVVWYEDIDDLAAGKTRGEVSKLMDVLDNIQNKSAEVIAIFTSNFADRIEKGVLRPGRIDAVIHVGALDADGTERLVRALLPGLLAPDVDFVAVGEACEGYLPAFLTETVNRAVRYAIAREKGRPSSITTSDLVQAATGLRPQLELMLNAGQAEIDDRSLQTALEALIAKVIQQHEVDGMGELVAKDAS
jgi:transitional endoplasmic reticulum ATPase